MPFQWSESRGRYVDADTGRILSRAAVRGWIEDSIAASEQAVGGFASLISEGSLTVDGWRNAMREEVKREYIRQYLLAAGGRYKMTKSDWGKVGSMLREQYRYLDAFAGAVAEGGLSESQIAARSRMYVNSAREAFEVSNRRTAARYGYDEVKWELGVAAEHCGDCASFADAGWLKIEDEPYGGAFPGSGDTQCLTGCKCHLSYRNSTTGKSF